MQNDSLNKEYLIEQGELLPRIYKELPERQDDSRWLLSGLIPDKGISVLSGKQATFKTLFALKFGLCLTSGVSFFEHKVNVPCDVLYIDEENGAPIIKDRLNKLGIDSNNDKFKFLCTRGVKLSDAVTLEKIKDIIKENPEIKLIVCDTFRRLHTLREDKADDMNELFMDLQKMSHDHGVAFLLLHHKRKGNKNNYDMDPMDELRGSSELGNIAVSVITLNKSNKIHDRVTLRVIKIRDMAQPEGELFKINWDEMGISFENLGSADNILSQADECAKAIVEWMLEHSMEKKTKEIMKQFKQTYNNMTIKRGLKTAFDDGRLVKPQRGVYKIRVEVDAKLDNF